MTGYHASWRFVLASIAIVPGFAQPFEYVKRKEAEAEKRIVRLPPTAYPELPANVIRELQRRGCKIPQWHFAKEPHNVVKGEFARPGQTDWAVLCSIKGVSRILVFWNGSETNPAAIAAGEDRASLQVVGEDYEFGYSRGIQPVGKDDIMGCYRASGGPKPPPIDHQGIDDAFIWKASVVRHFYNGKWLRLAGAD